MQTLNIDKEFSSLIAPLSEMEYHFLEASIRKDGCMEPIVVWRATIIDGHNRYHNSGDARSLDELYQRTD